MLSHVLQLKIAVPITMLRNINQPKLCNGTRLAIEPLMSIVVDTSILTGSFKGFENAQGNIPKTGVPRFRDFPVISSLCVKETLAIIL
ncbi:hypothetical protein SprV_0602159700 [Sparganum proliferum]